MRQPVMYYYEARYYNPRISIFINVHRQLDKEITNAYYTQIKKVI